MFNTKRIFKQNVTLQMENYEAAMSKSVLTEFFEGRSYDLILKTGPDKKETGCHQMILAVSSDFLRKIITTSTPGTIPVIILPDIKSTVVQYLILYLYKGEVEVPSEVYQDFIEACHLLQLKGSVNDDQPSNNPNKASTVDSEINLPPLDIGVKLEPEPGELQHERLFYPDQDMECYEVGDDSNDFMYQDYQGGSSFDANNHTNAQNLPKKAKRESYVSQSKISVTPEETESLGGRLKTVLKCVYEACSAGYTERIAENIERTKLIINDDKLIKAEHACGLCETIIPVSYMIKKRTGGFQAWINSSVRNHLSRSHQLKPQFLWNNMKRGDKESKILELNHLMGPTSSNASAVINLL